MKKISMDKKQYVLQEIKRVAESIAPKRLTKEIFLRESSIPESTVRYHFGSWNRAVEATGLEPNPPYSVAGHKRFSDQELLGEIGRLWKQFGRRPTEDLMNSKGNYSVKRLCCINPQKLGYILIPIPNYPAT